MNTVLARKITITALCKCQKIISLARFSKGIDRIFAGEDLSPSDKTTINYKQLRDQRQAIWANRKLVANRNSEWRADHLQICPRSLSPGTPKKLQSATDQAQFVTIEYHD